MNKVKDFTLLILDSGATLLDSAGTPLLSLSPATSLGNGQSGQSESLRTLLSSKARVQLVLANPGATIQCAEVPYLTPRERGEVRTRLVKTVGDPTAHYSAASLHLDPHASGGHVLWVASQPRAELDPWLTLLQEMGATPVFITPWQRALLEAVHEPHPSALYLTLETGLARLFFARGLNLRFTRYFPLPESLDPHQPAETGALELSRVIHEELSLILQFIQQKHRGAAPTALFTVGLPASPSPFLDSVRLDLGLTITNLATDLPTFLADGADRERERKDRLDLLPEEIRQARRLATYKILVRTGAAVMLLLCGATAALVRHQVKVLEQEAIKAEVGLEQRQSMARQGEVASRLRFGLLRVRQAEDRQRGAIEHLEQLGVRLLQTPPGVRLNRVEIAQTSGADLTQAFKVEGSAMTGSEFSVGALASYLDRLAEEPGLKLQPLQDVGVVDSEATAGGGGAEQALTRFKLEGTAP